jgi:hypothetical protein
LGNGINKFEANALRLGVELHKDPDNLHSKQKEKFNSVASMQKIRNRVSIAEKARVEKEKRQRKLRIEEARAREVYKDIKDEEDLMAKYRGFSDDYIIKGYQTVFDTHCSEMIKENRVAHARDIAVEKKKNSWKITQALGTTTKEQFFETKKKAELALNECLLGERIVSYRKHYETCWDVMEYMGEMAEMCYSQMGGTISTQIDPIFWRRMEDKFIDFVPLIDDGSTKADRRIAQNKSLVGLSSINKMVQMFDKYMSGDESFSIPFTYSIFLASPETSSGPYNFLDYIVREIID